MTSGNIENITVRSKTPGHASMHEIAWKPYEFGSGWCFLKARKRVILIRQNASHFQ